MTQSTAGSGSIAVPRASWGEKLAAATPFLVLVPSLVATLIYVFLFTAWTIYVSLSKSAMFPVSTFQGTKAYSDLWANVRWNIAFHNLFVYSFFYVIGAMA
ncbi:MAG: sugar ABC transporter permease, partial [Devosia sp.]